MTGIIVAVDDYGPIIEAYNVVYSPQSDPLSVLKSSGFDIIGIGSNKIYAYSLESELGNGGVILKEVSRSPELSYLVIFIGSNQEYVDTARNKFFANPAPLSIKTDHVAGLEMLLLDEGLEEPEDGDS